jgi:2-dehydropantoate 2-reductase
MIELASSNSSLNIRLKSICKILESVGIKTIISEEESYVTWSKLVRLDAISSFSAAYDMSVGELRSDTFIRTQMIDYIDETIRVASIEGYFTSSAIVMEQIDKLPHELKTSLQKDIKEKRESELDSITGGIMDLALKNNINIPNHNLIYNMIKSKN